MFNGTKIPIPFALMPLPFIQNNIYLLLFIGSLSVVSYCFYIKITLLSQSYNCAIMGLSVPFYRGVQTALFQEKIKLKYKKSAALVK